MLRRRDARAGIPSGLVAVALVAGVEAVLLARIHDYVLLGWDTFPEIASARVRGLDDLLGTFTEQTTGGVYPFSFYRPVFNLSLALDFALWGTRPFGYHLTDAALAGLCALSLFILARRLLGAGGGTGAWTAVVVFLILPVHGEVMPLPSRRMDVLCGLFAMLALASQTAALERRSRLVGLAPGLLTLLAVGSKEAGVVLPPLVFALVLSLRATRPVRERLAGAVIATAPHALAVALVFAARLAVLGELGGHGTTSLQGGLTRLPQALGTVVIGLSSLVRTDAPGLGPDRVAAVGLVALGAGIALVGWGATTGPGASSEDREARARRGPRVAIGLAAAWILLLGVVYGINGFVQAWYLLQPGLALALLLGGVAQRATFTFREEPRPSSPRRVVAAAALLVVTLAVAVQLRHSPLLHGFGHWSRGSLLLERYLDLVAERIEAAEDGELIGVPLPPIWIPTDANTTGSRQATLLHVYSLPSWAELRYPRRRIDFRHPRLGDSRAHPEAGKLVVRVEGAWP